MPDLWQAIARKMRGHFNDFGVTDNSPALWCFDHGATLSSPDARGTGARPQGAQARRKGARSDRGADAE
jgi:hypothetical protein